ncbi:PREDICTED: probable tyrosyl-DNA phosphodiesterase isoform X1 [Polistes canadensis]|uniref:probable tyrosyl-DNA phosphodiesterase isoform X1 n=2 Tax=Polistes canadensis TaxID=91411 RepID=UPI000718E5D9|nr:PREDICTED: probable tyrosyl-DNA phosphodiesterase isoform X1 [Polistes canadensis]XP_014612771.1 PREDICTED: probable tyrosyl-DNA phosphodiesterase isoform X1 [Polistes canadensis]
MISATNETSLIDRKICPFMEKCYRKNPIHFAEMSHPHLERLVIDQLDETIKIPNNLDFECDRTQLLQQLKVMQVILRRERDRDVDSFLQLKINLFSTVTTKSSSTSESSKTKDVMTNRRTNEQKMEMNDKIKNLSETANENNKKEPEMLTTMVNEKLEDIVKSEKRNIQSEEMTKKIKANNNIIDSVVKASSSRECNSNAKSMESIASSSTDNTSLMDMYLSSKDCKEREQMRNKAIKMMKREGFQIYEVTPGQFIHKYKRASPYNIFFTRIRKSTQTSNESLTVTFPEILDISLGEIKSSLQINFMVDVGWLCLQYLLAAQKANITIVYQDRMDNEKLGDNITLVRVAAPSRFGCHHTKMMILKYQDGGIRIVMSTANLYEDDWENRTQGLWISPYLPPIKGSIDTASGESKTGFKKDLIQYLNNYQNSALVNWIFTVRMADCSAINVFFIASVPGTHSLKNIDSWGHKKLGHVLSNHVTLPADAPNWPIIAQSSSLGSLGPQYSSWLGKDIVLSMSKETDKSLKSPPTFYFIFPSIKNYRESYDCRQLSCCLCYNLLTHSKQEWFQSYLHQWKASKMHRTKAMPHIKTYARLSPDLKKMAWFMLTSANLSKAAWGKCGTNYSIMSYEAGVLFLPEFVTGEKMFSLEGNDSKFPPFPIPYDLPLTPYETGDRPFVTEFFRE